MYKPITNIADMAGKYFQYSIGDAVALKAVEQFTKVVPVFQYSIGDAVGGQKQDQDATEELSILHGRCIAAIQAVINEVFGPLFQYSIGDVGGSYS